MMDYLKTLGISELLTYLEIESESDNFKKVEKILLSREKNTTKHADDLEKNLKMHKDKLEEMKKMSVAVQSKLEEFKEYKVVYNKLEEKFTRMERDCKTISEREKRVLTELQRVTRIRNEEVTEFKTKYNDLECAKQKAEDENEVQKRRCKELETDLEFYKSKCSEVSMALEEKNTKCTALESKLEEFNEYRMMCSELKERVTCLEQDCKIVSEREKRAVQNVSSLSAELEHVKENSNKELIEYKTKNKDLECAKQKAENEIEIREKRYKELEKMMKDLEMYKGKCSGLSTALEVMNNRNIAVEGKLEEIMNKRNIAVENKLEELKKDIELYKGKCCDLYMELEKLKNKNIGLEGKLEEYKGICEKLNEKIARLEEECKTVSVREKNAIQIINKLSADLEIVSRDKNEEVLKILLEDELEKMLKSTIILEKDLEIYKGKCSDLSTALEKSEKMVKNTIILEKDLEIYKAKCSELSMAVEESEKTLKNKIILEKDLEFYKATCSELSMALEEKKKKKENISVEGKLEKCKKSRKRQDRGNGRGSYGGPQTPDQMGYLNMGNEQGSYRLPSCWNCKDVGHMRSDCPVLLRMRERNKRKKGEIVGKVNLI